MKPIEVSYEALKSIVGEDVSFSLALKHLFSQEKYTAKEKNEVSVIVGCALRHYYIFDELISRYFPSLDVYSRCAFYILMSELRFLNKGGDNSEDIDFVKETLKNNKVEYQEDDFDDLVDYVQNNPVLIPQDVDTTSVEYVHYRYNLPIPIVKMWIKSLGRNTAYHLFKIFSRSITKYYRIDTLKMDEATFKETYSDSFCYDCGVDNVVYPNLEKSTSKRDTNIAINKCHLFSTTLGLEKILDSIDIKETDSVAALSSSLTPLYLSLATRLRTNLNKIDVIFESGADYYKATKGMHGYGIENVRFYNATPSSFITCISEPVDYFFLSPKNSNFELFRLSPDYAIHFKMETLDALIENERQSLEEASPLVKEGGKIVYVVPTISHKEGKTLISDFLKNHEEFSLVEENQFLPIDEEYNCSLYYAILAKERTEK